MIGFMPLTFSFWLSVMRLFLFFIAIASGVLGIFLFTRHSYPFDLIITLATLLLLILVGISARWHPLANFLEQLRYLVD